MDIIFLTGVYVKNIYRAIGPYQLAHWMRSHGYQCQVIDFIQRMSREEILQWTAKFITSETLCIGVSSTFWDRSHRSTETGKLLIPSDLEWALRQIRAQYPHIKLVVGGSSADNIDEASYSLFDASIIGDAEDSFLKLVNSYKTNTRIFHSVTRGGVPYIESPPPTLFDIQHLAHRFTHNDCIVPGEALPIEISRGCIFRCAFCNYPHLGKTKFDYLRNFDLIGEEIEYNYHNFNTDKYYIVDDTFNDSDTKMTAWYNIVKQLQFPIHYTGYLRADLLHRNPRHADMLQESGLMSCHFGIETLHPEASKIIGKGWSGKEATTFLPQLKSKWQQGVTVHCSLIVGLPPEIFEDLQYTQRWFMDSGVDSWNFKPLLIQGDSRYTSSTFDKNYQQYGFELWGRGWKTQYMNSREAVSHAETLNKLGESRQRLTIWAALYRMGLGASLEEVNNRYISELSHNHIREQLFMAQYKLLLDAV